MEFKVITDNVDIVVVGAGPVGSVAAARLVQCGFSVIVCEAEATSTQNLRASTFHPPTLEMLDTLGVADQVIKEGLKAPVYHWRKRETGEVFSFDFGELADRTTHPYRIQCEQHHLSRMLAEKLAGEAKCDLRYNTRVVNVQQDADGVDVTLETPLEIQHVRAKYVIGADGANSIVRKYLGIGFEGFTYPEKFLCLSTEMDLADHIDGLAYVNYVSDPEEWLVLLRVPRLWRVLVPTTEGDDDEWLLSDAKKNEVFERLVGRSDVETAHRTIYKVHQRVAERFNQGRMFLVGDAAHLNNPLGGFGMNSGIHDAWNLAGKLDDVERHGASPSVFDRFDRQRRAITHQFVQRQTIDNMELMNGEGGKQKQMRDRMSRLNDDPVARREFLLYQSMIKSLDDAEAIL